MAAVYLARDLRHDCPVALKVLHPQLAASERSLQIDPTHLGQLESHAVMFAARGDLAGARAA